MICIMYETITKSNKTYTLLTIYRFHIQYVRSHGGLVIRGLLISSHFFGEILSKYKATIIHIIRKMIIVY